MNKLITLLLTVVLLTSTTACSDNIKELMEEKINEGQQEQSTDAETNENEKSIEIPDPSYGGTLKLVTGNPESYNPFVNRDRDVDVMLGFIYEKLFVLDNSFKPVPVLVDNYVFDEDGAGVVLTLSGKAVFSDGSPVTSYDVLFSYETSKTNPDNIYSPNTQNIDRVIAVDEQTVHVLFKQAYAFGLYDLAFPIVREGAEGTLLGTGPYMYESDQGMKEVVLTRNESWYNEKPYIDKLHFAVASDPVVQENMYDQHLIDAINPDRFDWTKYSDDAANNIYEYPSLYYQFIAFSPTSVLFDSLEARQALEMAIDKSALASNLYLNHAIPVRTPVPPNAWYNTIDDTASVHDPASAADYFQSITGDTAATLLVRSDMPTHIAIGEYLKSTLEDMGIQLAVEAVDAESYHSRLLSGDYDLAAAGWKMSASPDYTPLFHSSYVNTGTNFINFNSVEMDTALASLFKSTSDEMLLEAVGNFQTLWLLELPYLSLFYLNGAVMLHDNVYGELDPSCLDTFSGLNNIYLDN